MSLRSMILVPVFAAVMGCGPAIVVDSGGLGAAEVGPFQCNLEYPKEGLWWAERGYGRATVEVDAIAMAQQEARKNLLRWAGARLTDSDKLELEAAIDTTWVKPSSRCIEGVCEACAVALARRSGPTMEEAVAALKTGLKERLVRFLQDVPKAGKGSQSSNMRVRVAVPLWPDSQTAGEAGSLMFTQIWSSLGDCLPQVGSVPLAKPGSPDWDVELAGELTLEGGGCALALSYYRRGETTLTPLGIVPFQPKAIGLRECNPPAQTYTSDSRMGLRSGRKEGSGGLQVRLEAPTHGGLLCEGEKFAWRVEASQPAYVRIYSVADDGRVMLGWESKEPVTVWEPGPKSMAIPIRMGENLHYRLVAVAVPAGLGAGAFGRAVPPAGCMARRQTGLSAERLPGEAAVAALTFGVTPIGERDCPKTPEMEAMLRNIQEALKKIPECGE